MTDEELSAIEVRRLRADNANLLAALDEMTKALTAAFESPLGLAMAVMLASRARNADNFAMTAIKDTFLYIMEELSELVRAHNNLTMNHLRANPLTEAEARAKQVMEAGDLLYMVLTALHQLQIDPDAALKASCAKIDDRCAARRATRS